MFFFVNFFDFNNPKNKQKLNTFAEAHRGNEKFSKEIDSEKNKYKFFFI